MTDSYTGLLEQKKGLEFNSFENSFVSQYGRRFFVMENQYGAVMSRENALCI